MEIDKMSADFGAHDLLGRTPSARAPKSIIEQIKKEKKRHLWDPIAPCDRSSHYKEEKENFELDNCTFQPQIIKNRLQREIESDLKPWSCRQQEYIEAKQKNIEFKKKLI